MISGAARWTGVRGSITVLPSGDRIWPRERQGMVREVADDADGGAAGAVEGGEEGAFGVDGGSGRRVVQRGDELGGAGIVGRGFRCRWRPGRGRGETLGIEIGCYLGPAGPAG